MNRTRVKSLNASVVLGAILGVALGIQLAAQSWDPRAIEDKKLLEVMIEDTQSELSRNEASLEELHSVQNGVRGDRAQDQELKATVEEHILYYEAMITSQQDYLTQLRDRFWELEQKELEQLRNLRNFGSPYADSRRTAFLDRILKPGSSTARFGESGKTRMENLDAELFAAIGGLQERLNQEARNRQEASQIVLDREANVNTILEMQTVSQQYYDERFVLYEKMNQTYEQIFRWRPDIALLFRPPPRPKPPEAYQRALERMQEQQP